MLLILLNIYCCYWWYFSCFQVTKTCCCCLFFSILLLYCWLLLLLLKCCQCCCCCWFSNCCCCLIVSCSSQVYFKYAFSSIYQRIIFVLWCPYDKTMDYVINQSQEKSELHSFPPPSCPPSSYHFSFIPFSSLLFYDYNLTGERGRVKSWQWFPSATYCLFQWIEWKNLMMEALFLLGNAKPIDSIPIFIGKRFRRRPEVPLSLEDDVFIDCKALCPSLFTLRWVFPISVNGFCLLPPLFLAPPPIPFNQPLSWPINLLKRKQFLFVLGKGGEVRNGQ